MKTADVILRNKQGAIVSNDDMMYFDIDTEKRFPLRRITRWALIQTAKVMDTDCNGMGGEDDWGVDTFWSYFNEFYPELAAELPSDGDFEDLLINRFNL